MGTRLRALQPVVDQVLRNGHLPDAGVVVPGAAEHVKFVGEFVREVLVDGMLNADEEMQVLRGLERQRFGPDVRVKVSQTVEPVVPNEAVAFVRDRQVLAGKWNRDLDSSVTQVLAAALEQGATTQETMDALREVFPAFADRRLENIARTESTAAFNQGRLTTFRQQDDFIPAVQFLAVLDSRTTAICRARNGLIMRLDDERLAANTPPLHFQCRSMLSPITKLELARLERGDAAAEKRAFGWVEPREPGLPPAPRDLEAALDGWERVQPPLPGFGGELAQPAPKPARAKQQPKGSDSREEKPANEPSDSRDTGGEAGRAGATPPTPGTPPTSPPPPPARPTDRPFPEPEPEPHSHVLHDRKEQEDWYQRHAVSWRDSLSNEEREAVLVYKDSTDDVAGVLTGRSPLTPETEARIAAIDNALSKGTIDSGVVVFRGFGSHEAPQYSAGDEISSVSYVSTSLNYGVAKAFAGTYGKNGVVAQIELPKGFEAGFPDILSHEYSDELEVLLERGLILRVKKMERHPTEAHWVMIAEVMVDE